LPFVRKALAGGLLVLISACSTTAAKQTGTTPSASAARTSSATPSPTPAPAAAPAADPAVALIDWDANGSTYTLSLVSASATVLATAHATWTRGARCGPVQAGIIAPPPVSTSNRRAYYLDGAAIRWLGEDGQTGLAFQGLSNNAIKAYGLAVAPDDSVFALNTIDYSTSPISQRITITKVGASSLGSEIYAATSPANAANAAVWPVGWRNGDLVLAYHSGTCTQGGGPGLGDARSYHVVSAQTADRKATIGSDTGAACGLVGAPMPAGILCGNYQGIGDQASTQVLNWSGQQVATFGAWFLPGGLAPQGRSYVGNGVSGNQAPLTLIRAGGGQVTVPVGDCFACAVMWIDDSHFIVAPYQAAPQVFASAPDPLKGTPVAAQGYPVARIPGSLDGT
jgi:hypothetical protein